MFSIIQCTKNLEYFECDTCFSFKELGNIRELTNNEKWSGKPSDCSLLT